MPLTPGQLAHELDTKQIHWRNLSQRQRRAAIVHAMSHMLVEDYFLTTRRWDAERPIWAPMARNLAGSTGATLTELADRIGLPMRTSLQRCDCGARGAHVVPVTQLTAESHESHQTLRLCDACYAEFLAMEALHA